MKKEDKQFSVNSILYDLVQGALLILKAIGYIDWPWWKVLIPTWTVLGLVLVLALIMLILKGAERVASE